MSLKIILTLLAISGGAGIGFGYVLRILVSLGQRGSLELEIKQRTLTAKEQAAKVLEEAQARSQALETETLDALSEREERLAKKEEFLDTRQADLDTATE